jgi:hypothetical protein
MFQAAHCHELASGQCGHCGRTVIFARRLWLPDHRWHAVMSLLTGGLWLVGWIACSLRAGNSIWECAECGAQACRPTPTPPLLASDWDLTHPLPSEPEPAPLEVG